MRQDKKINYVQLTEALNTLLADPAIRERRYGQVNMVREKLLVRVRSRLAAQDFPEETRQAYLSGSADAETHLAGLLPELLSQRKLRQFFFLQGRKRSLALEFLEECLLEKEQIRFRKETGLSAKVWLGFYKSIAASSEKTLQIIRDHLELTHGERVRFDALTILEFFPAKDPLKREVHFRRKETGMAILEFLDFSYVSKDAWEAFYPIPAEPGDTPEDSSPEPPRITSQETLLKLIIGFGLKEADARALLALAGSDFILLRDLVFLASIRMNCGHPDYLPEILDFFAEGEDGKLLYANPYSRSI